MGRQRCPGLSIPLGVTGSFLDANSPGHPQYYGAASGSSEASRSAQNWDAIVDVVRRRRPAVRLRAYEAADGTALCSNDCAHRERRGPRPVLRASWGVRCGGVALCETSGENESVSLRARSGFVGAEN